MEVNQRMVVIRLDKYLNWGDCEVEKLKWSVFLQRGE